MRLTRNFAMHIWKISFFLIACMSILHAYDNNFSFAIKNNLKALKYSMHISSTGECSNKLLKRLRINLRHTGIFYIKHNRNNVDYIIHGVCKIYKDTKGKKRYIADFNIVDSEGGNYSTKFSKKHTSISKLGNNLTDAIYKFSTGNNGYFSERLFYIKKTSNYGGYMMVANITANRGVQITKGRDYILQPITSGNKIVYVLFSGRRIYPTKIYLYDFATNKKTALSNPNKSAFSASIAHKNKSKIAFSMSSGRNVELYEYNTNTKRRRRLTYFHAITTSPTYNPKKNNVLAVASDMGGGGNIYILDTKSKKYKRISHGSGVYSAPSWSPNGNYIAFIKLHKNRFYLGVFDVKNRFKEYILLGGKYLDSPSWSASGTAIAYITNKVARGDDRGYIGVFDILGRGNWILNIGNNVTDPNWHMA